MISIHALREEGDPAAIRSLFTAIDFYPRPPRGGRPGSLRDHGNGFLFLSTPSARRATAGKASSASTIWISIHALREEGDSVDHTPAPLPVYFYPRPPRGGRPRIASGGFSFQCNFYPRPPRGGRPFSLGILPPVSIFLSTPSARRATRRGRCESNGRYISIHALREEGDASAPVGKWQCFYFYPRPPRGGRLCPLKIFT